MKHSKFLSLNLSDFQKGALTAFFASLIAALIQIVSAGTLWLTWEQWQLVLGAALVGMLGYISKNLTTNSDGKPLKKEPPAA